MQPALHQDLADQLWEADRSAKPVAPLTDRYDGLDIEDAYAIQSINIERRPGHRALSPIRRAVTAGAGGGARPSG